MADEFPQRFGDYLLLEKIGVGGMAEVFKAKTFGVEGFERLIAIKRLLPYLTGDKRFGDMFVDEARLAVQLSNQHIVQSFEFGAVDDRYYIVMEYLAGRDLRQILKDLAAKNEIMPTAFACFVASCICAALDYAHRKKDVDGMPLDIVHRDVSPQNILISFNGEVKLTDFGIAKAAARISEPTLGGALKGKIAYSSPEQLRGRPVDRRSDVFGIGLVLYEMLTGKRPFDGGTDLEILERVEKGVLIAPSRHNAKVPLHLDALVLRALARDPDVRYTWAGDMQEELLPFLVRDKKMVTERRMIKFMRRHYRDEARAERMRSEEASALADRLSSVDNEALEAPTQLAARKQVFARRSGRVLDPKTDEQPALQDVADTVEQDPPDFVKAERAIASALADTTAEVDLPVVGPDARAGADERIDWNATSTLIQDVTELPAPARPPPDRPANANGVSGLGIFLGLIGVALIVVVIALLVSRSQPDEPKVKPLRVVEATPGPETPGATPSAPTAPDVDPETPSQDGSSPALTPFGPRTARSARLSLSTEPPTEVIIRKKSVGFTPIDAIWLPPGSYQLNFRSAKRGINKSMRIRLKAGARVARDVTFAKGKLTVMAEPWAEVFIHGKKIGTTPLRAIPLWEGTYDIRLVNSNLSVERRRRVTIKPGETTRLIEKFD